MQVKEISKGKYVIRLMKNELLMASLKKFYKEKVTKKTICRVSGIGALNNIEVGLAKFDINKGVNYEYININHDCELLTMDGNLTFNLENNEIIPHIHITIADNDYTVKGGHLKEANIAVTVEIFIDVFDKEVSRKVDDETKLALLQVK